MKRRIRHKLIAALSMLVLVSIAACTGEDGAVGPQGPAGPVEPGINGLVVRNNYEDYYEREELIDLQALVNVTNAPGVPSAFINGEELPYNMEGMIYASGFSFWNGVFLDMGDDATLRVDYQKGGDSKTAGATVAVPDTFDLISPAGTAIITQAGSFDVEWESAPGAEKYWLMIDYDGEYVDDDGYVISFYRYMSRYVTGTSFTLNGSEIYPDRDDIDYYNSFGGSIYIYAVSGPIEEGDDFNITGDGTGRFTGITECSRYVNFTMLIPISGEEDGPEDREKPDIHQLMARFMGAG
ncbi:MAG: hypothetical protein GF417_05820 [Candidatus Latescibacteria bacterium]|nr:hypothetical protein [bacterium]MBD3423934.1 hypothetical protein [Candidatus Latescibacterota bacterium]